MDDKVRDILMQLNTAAEEDYSGFLRSGDRYYAVALAEGLTREQREEVLENTTLDYYLDKRSDIIRDHQEKRIMPLRRSIGEVLALYNDMKSGKRVAARKELQQRFPTQAWTDQIEILRAMLRMNTQTDVLWVLQMLASGFDSVVSQLETIAPEMHADFTKLLLTRCKEHIANPSLATYAMRYLPYDFVKENVAVLERTVDYRRLCLCLAQDPDYEIDEEKLTLFQLLDVLSHTGRTINPSGVWQRFCEWLRNVDEDTVAWDSRVQISQSQTGAAPTIQLSLADVQNVRWCIKSCGAMHLSDIICAIYNLDKRIQPRLHQAVTEDYANHRIPLTPYATDEHYKHLLIQLAKEELETGDICR